MEDGLAVIIYPGVTEGLAQTLHLQPVRPGEPCRPEEVMTASGSGALNELVVASPIAFGEGPIDPASAVCLSELAPGEADQRV